LHDKEKAIFNPGKEAIAAIADLPLKVAQNEPTHDISWLNKVALCRKTEQEKIVTNLGYNTQSLAYRPLGVYSDSKYLLQMYAKALQSIKGVNVERINVSDLVNYDLERTANNVFIRSVDEDRNNIFLISVVGDIPEQVIENVKGFLITEKRRKFHLSVPNVTMNLSNVLPIVFCDKRNMQALADVCDMVEIADVTQKEMPLLIADIVESKKAEYGITQVKWAEDVVDCFCNMRPDDIEKCIDKAIRAEALKFDSVHLDKGLLTKYKEGTTKSCYIGFGRTEL
jgi:hypothetical protein